MCEEIAEQMNLVEALLFASPEPQDHKRISRFLGKLTKADVYKVIEKLNEKYTEGGHCFRIREIADGFQICLLPNMTMAVEKFLKRQRERRLTPASLETLAIVAYKQPVTRGEMEHVRGVSVDGTLNTLLERKLVTIVGRSDKVGHPLLYGTTKKFLEYFGLKNLKELPRLEEFSETHKPKQKTSQRELELNKEETQDSNEADTNIRFVLKKSKGENISETPEYEGNRVIMEEANETE